MIDAIADSVLLIKENERAASYPGADKKSASSFMLLGLSSTGKTETPKALASELGIEPFVIDFSQVRTVQDMKEKILGTKFGGVAEKSDFMHAYDRTQGRLLVVFDEFSNAPSQVLMSLYDILREATVTTFSDGRPRDMHNAMIAITGNATQEIFH